MRPTRASAAVNRLNRRCPGLGYTLAVSGEHFQLGRDAPAGVEWLGEPLPLDSFVGMVDAMGPREVRRRTRNDIAFEKQLVRKSDP
jgi:hypothetical protein